MSEIVYEGMNKKLFDLYKTMSTIKTYYDTNNCENPDMKKSFKELEDAIGYIVFSDGYDENGNAVHKQEFVTYKDKCAELIEENKKLKDALKNEEEAHDLCINHYTEAMEDLRKQLKFECDARNRFVKRVSQLNESQNVVAIEELNKLRRLYKKTWALFGWLPKEELRDEIDRRIKELGGK